MHIQRKRRGRFRSALYWLTVVALCALILNLAARIWAQGHNRYIESAAIAVTATLEDTK